MIEPLYPLLDKQYVLFNEHLYALMNDALKVNVDRDNMYYSYCYSENMEDIYTVHFYKDGFTGIQIIVYWNGERMSYQSVSPGLNVDYKPKKSLKDECLGLIKDAVEIADSMIIYSDKGCDRRNKLRLCIDKLNDTLNKMEDNT